MIRQSNIQPMTMVVVAALALSGCGGGGGSSIRAIGEPTAHSDNSSITQRAPGRAPFADGDVEVTVDHNSNGDDHDFVFIAPDVDTGDPITINTGTASSGNTPSDDDFAFRRGEETIARGGSGNPMDVYDTVVLLGQDETVDGEGSAVIRGVTDIRADDDADYLLFGAWIYIPVNDEGDLETDYFAYHQGAFARGSQPFTQANIQGLTGTATYEGLATGININRRGSNLGATPFNADAMLIADFGDSSGLGTIRGTIDDYRVITDSGAPTNAAGRAAINALPDLTLEPTDIGDANSGFFGGDTSAAGGLSGRWGGRFYGNGGSATDHPGSVAGTFGASNPDQSEVVFGAFGAHRQP